MIKISLPSATPPDGAYARAKANGELISLDALQAKYSADYNCESPYANWPHNMDALAARVKNAPDARAEMTRILEHGESPELLERLANRFPGIVLDYIILTPLIDILDEDAALLDIVFKKNLLDEANKKIVLGKLERQFPELNLMQGTHSASLQYMGEWKKKFGYYPHCNLWRHNPTSLNTDVFNMVRRALIAEGHKAYSLAICAAAFFDTQADFLKFYAHYASQGNYARYLSKTNQAKGSLPGILTYLVNDFYAWKNPGRSEALDFSGYVLSTTPEERRAFIKTLERTATQKKWLPGSRQP